MKLLTLEDLKLTPKEFARKVHQLFNRRKIKYDQKQLAFDWYYHHKNKKKGGK